MKKEIKLSAFMTTNTVGAGNAIQIKCFEKVKADSYLGKMMIEFVKLSEDLEKVGKKRDEIDAKVFELDLKCTVLEAEGSKKYAEVHDEYITLKEELYKLGDEYREKYERYTFLWNELKWHGANPEEILEKDIKFVRESLASMKEESTNTVNTVSEEEVRKIEVTTQKGEVYHLAVMDFAVHGGAIVDERNNIIGSYADSETAGKVIDELKAAYDRGDKTFVMPANENVVKFEVGKVYYFNGMPTRTIDGDICPYEVTSRAAKSVMLKGLSSGDNTRRMIKVECGKETVTIDGWKLKASSVLSDESLEKYLKAQALYEETLMKWIKATEIENAASEVDASEYAVSVEAQDAAIEGEIENAASEKVKVNSDITDAAIAQVEKVQEISTAELEKELKGYQAEMRTCQNSIKKSREIIQDNQEYIIKALAQIAGFENMIMRYGLYIEEDAKKLEELKETAAKINAKLLSRQFKASALIESVKAAEKVQEVAGVNFDLQQFSEVVDEGSAATIDTAVSKTEVPYIEDDLDEEALIEEYYALDAEVDELHKKFTEKRKELNETRRKLEDVLKKKFKATQDKFYKTVEKAGDDDATIELYAQGRKKHWFAGGEWESHWIEGYCWDKFSIYLDFGNYPEYVIAYDSVSLANYRTIDAVKAAVDKFGAAIEHGDKEFTFPVEEVQIENKSAEVEIKSAVSEIETYDSKIDALQAQIAELNEAKEKAKGKLDGQAEELKKFVMETVKFKPIEGANKFAGRLINIGRRSLTELEKEWLEVEIDGGKVRLIEVASRKVVLAEYSSVKEFKAAIRELAAAIERGDKEFTFPADK